MYVILVHSTFYFLTSKQPRSKFEYDLKNRPLGSERILVRLQILEYAKTQILLVLISQEFYHCDFFCCDAQSNETTHDSASRDNNVVWFCWFVWYLLNHRTELSLVFRVGTTDNNINCNSSNALGNNARSDRPRLNDVVTYR